ncbi:MAG: hypothetical protein ACFFDF_12565, partial [Candidatus Odinarchaeota archaeon]
MLGSINNKNYFSNVIKPPNISKNIKNFQEIDYQIEIWEDNIIWTHNNNKNVSGKFRKLIDELKPHIIKFKKEGYPKNYYCIFNQDPNFMRKLSWGISEYENILDALFYANGWKGLIGLELSKVKLKEFQDKHKRLPTQREFEIISNKNIHKKKYWTRLGINTWNDLLLATFGKVNIDYNRYSGEEGLKNAREVLIKFHKCNKILPTARYKETLCYANIIARGVWSDLGINTWNDLLKKTFGKINKPNRIYKGEHGLERAKSELLQFFKTHKRKPTSEENSVSSILVAIKRDYWNKFGIASWNDLLHFVFGSVNVENRIWNGKNGLENAIKKLRDYFKQTRQLPSRRVKGMSGIVK